jgi:type III secretion protein J
MLTIRTLSKHLNTFMLLLIAVVLCTSCESRKTIVNALDEKEANEILVFLGTKGIAGLKTQAIAEGGGGSSKGVLWNISVDANRSTEAMALLNQAGLPRRRSQNIIEVIGNTGLVPSSAYEKIRFQAALAEQLASTIRKIDGILDADVTISFPEEDPLNPNVKKQKVTASVYVKHNGILDDPNAHLETRIRRLVASGVNGLNFDNVTIIKDRARFGDTLFGAYALASQEKSFVDIWSIIIEKESVTRFRILFFSLSLLILILLSFTGWILWKFSPITKRLGGFKKLITASRLEPEEIPAAPLNEDKKEKVEGESDDLNDDNKNDADRE